MPRRTEDRRAGLVRVALLLDGVAVLLLGVAAAAAHWGALLWETVTAVPSALLALVGAVMTGIVLTERLAGVRRGLACAAAVVATLVVVPFGAVVLAVSADSEPNPAAVATVPLTHVVERAGGRRLCEVGDAGRGWDNRQPQSVSIYRAPADAGQLRDQLVAAARSRGYVVSGSMQYDEQHRLTPRVVVATGADATPSRCGDTAEEAGAGQQLMQIRVIYPYSYWDDRRKAAAQS